MAGKKRNTKANNTPKKTMKFSLDRSDFSGELSDYYLSELNVSRKGGGFVSWGNHNLFPHHLFDLYLNCSTLQTIVNGILSYTLGDGIEAHPEVLRIIDNKKLDDVIRQVILDYIIFGGFAVQRIKSLTGEVAGIENIDMRCFRLSHNRTDAYINDSWSLYTRSYYRLPISDTEGSDDSPIDVYYYKGELSRGYYPLPSWFAVIKNIKTLIEIDNFHFNSIKRNLSPSSIVNINNGGPSEEEMDEFEKDFSAHYQGTDNAGKAMLFYNNSKDQAATIERLSDDNYDQKYQSLLTTCRQNVYSSFKATPNLFGINTESTGFNKEEYEDAFDIFNSTVIIPLQQNIEMCFDEIFGVENAIKFIPKSMRSLTWSNIPSAFLEVLTVDEKRELLGYQKIQ